LTKWYNLRHIISDQNLRIQNQRRKEAEESQIKLTGAALFATKRIAKKQKCAGDWEEMDNNSAEMGGLNNETESFFSRGGGKEKIYLMDFTRG